MSQVYKFQKLDTSVVSKRLKEKFKSNTQIVVPKNHLCIVMNLSTMQKQRMFEGTQKIRALEKKRSLFKLNLNSKRHPYYLYLINKDFRFENLWGGQFLFEDKTTKNEMRFGVNGSIHFSLKDFESLYEIMEKEDLDFIDTDKIKKMYDKQRKSMNNAIITFLTNWSSNLSSIKNLKNKKNEAQEFIKSNLNTNELNPFIEVNKILINEYVSNEAEENRLTKNKSNTEKFVRESSGENEKEIIIIEQENLSDGVSEEIDELNEKGEK